MSYSTIEAALETLLDGYTDAPHVLTSGANLRRGDFRAKDEPGTTVACVITMGADSDYADAFGTHRAHGKRQARHRPALSLFWKRGTALGEIAADPHHSRVAERHDPLLVTFAETLHVALVQPDVSEAKSDELGDAQARCVEDLDERAIADAARRRDVGRRQQRVDLIEREKPRQRGERPIKPHC